MLPARAPSRPVGHGSLTGSPRSPPWRARRIEHDAQTLAPSGLAQEVPQKGVVKNSPPRWCTVQHPGENSPARWCTVHHPFSPHPVARRATPFTPPRCTARHPFSPHPVARRATPFHPTPLHGAPPPFHPTPLHGADADVPSRGRRVLAVATVRSKKVIAGFATEAARQRSAAARGATVPRRGEEAPPFAASPAPPRNLALTLRDAPPSPLLGRPKKSLAPHARDASAESVARDLVEQALPRQTELLGRVAAVAGGLDEGLRDLALLQRRDLLFERRTVVARTPGLGAARP